MKNKNSDEKKENKLLLYLKIILIILLLIICVVTSFRTGQKYFLLRNTQFEDSNSNIETDIAKWNFEARIVL
jgi:flagellar basal body-associated protein FliL